MSNSLTEVSASCTPAGGSSPPAFHDGPPERRIPHLRAAPTGGFTQLLRQPFARLCDGLRHDERGVLVWLLIEANRRHWGRPGTPVLTISKKGLADYLGIERRRAARILDRLVDVGAVAWTPATGGLDSELEVLVYDQVVANGRRDRGTDFCAVLCGPVDDALDDLGFDAWAVLALATIEVGSVTQTIVGPATGIAAHLGLSWYRLRPIVEVLSAAGRVAWTRSAAGARLRLTSYADVALSGTVAADRGEIRIGAHRSAAGTQKPPRRHQKAATATQGDIKKPPRRHGKSATAPAVSPPSLEEQLEEEPLEVQPPQPPQCSTPPEPKAKSGGMLQEAPQVVVDQEHSDVDVFLDDLLDAVNELAEDTDDDKSGPRLAHALARSTRGTHLLRVRASERLAAGWTPWDLALETAGSRDLLSASFVDSVLASRLDALPLSPPERVEDKLESSPPVVVIEGEPPEAVYGPFVTSPGADEPAIDAFDAVFGSFSRPSAAELSRAAIDVEATLSAPETSPETVTDVHESASIESPRAMPPHDVDQGADERLCDVSAPAVASSSGPRKVIDLDVTGPPEPAPRPPTPGADAMVRAVVEALRAGSRPERGRRPFGAPDEPPRPAFGLPTSPERPVGARLSASEGIRGVIAPETPERGADGDAAQARADRLRANDAAREAKRAQEGRHVPQWQAAS